MSTLLLIQLGVGQVGAAFTALVHRLSGEWRMKYGVSMRYYALADSSGFVVPDATTGQLAPEALVSILEARAVGQPLNTSANSLPASDWRIVLKQAFYAARRPDRVIVVDCAVGYNTTELLLAARAAGAHVVLCNKDPLTGPYHEFQALQGDTQHGSLRLSATVGAGLPITSAVAAATISGDTVIELESVASGSLGLLCSAMSAGADFPEALLSAIEAGYCEPDPRVDLSGHDVARKLLILARLAGYQVEIADVAVERLIPQGAELLSREEFLAALPTWREHLRDRFANARASGHVLRYVGTMDERGALRANLRAVSPDDPLARTAGPENVFVLGTERQGQRHPLVIAGPGAGVSVTAGAVVSDILRAAGVL